VVDWDGDGLDDLIAPVGIQSGKLVDGNPQPDGRLYFYRNIGTREHPRYAAEEEIRRPDGPPPMAAAVVNAIDWDGDGRPELVGFDFEGRLCVFRQTADPLVLGPGIPLRMADGGEFTYDVVYEMVGKPWGANQTICDWENRGIWDIVVGTREMLILFRNLGTNEKPAYGPGERMSLWGQEIRHSIHCLRPYPVDWDSTGRVDLVVGSESGWFHLFRRPALDSPRPKAMIGVPVRGTKS
jgi:hypothetical protein